MPLCVSSGKKFTVMKTIIVLTDFSENATCAAGVALQLSTKLRTDLLLFNTYIDYSTMQYYSGGGWIVDEFTEQKKNSKQGLELLTEGLESLANALEPHSYKPTISFKFNDNSLDMNLVDMLEHNQVELIVMGARSHDHDDALYGHDTKSVINHTTRPVLIVPAKTDLEQIRKVVFATDFEEGDLTAINYLVKLCKLFDYQLDIIHVLKPNEKVSAYSAEEVVLKEKLEKMSFEGFAYHQIGGKDVIERLNELCTEAAPALLALLHHRRSFFAQLFAKSETNKALAKQQIPLLVFPTTIA
jgi:nucleotide-binding universal stress UspA family protein